MELTDAADASTQTAISDCGYHKDNTGTPESSKLVTKTYSKHQNEEKIGNLSDDIKNSIREDDINTVNEKKHKHSEVPEEKNFDNLPDENQFAGEK